MSKEQQITSAVYRQIAIDIAKNIVNGKYVEGQRLFGRSVLASQYKVSPETIRKAVYLLKDVGILNTEKGSGIEVISMAKAKDFVKHYNSISSISDIKSEITSWTHRQIKETTDIMQKIQLIIDTTERLKMAPPFNPYEIEISSDSTAIGKTSTELQFWHNTGGTIIAIRRGDTLILSPGPYATFCEGDIFYIIGNEQAYLASKKLLYS